MTTNKGTRSKKADSVEEQELEVNITVEAPEAPKKSDKKDSDKVKTVEQLAKEVIRGVHGSGRERMLSLGSKYAEVQQEVTRLQRLKK